MYLYTYIHKKNVSFCSFPSKKNNNNTKKKEAGTHQDNTSSNKRKSESILASTEILC